MPVVATVWTLVLCAAAIVAYHRARRTAYVACKVLASAGFLTVALSGGPPVSGWRVAMIAGLAVAVLGDALLALRGTRAFIAGMLGFLVMHAAYLTGFSMRGVRPTSLLLGGAIALAATVTVWRWARPHLSSRLRPAIAVYMAVLACDLAAGISAGVAAPAPLMALGVLLVCVSDIAVLRQRFVAPTMVNKLVGLPMYYAGQLLLAWAALTLA